MSKGIFVVSMSNDYGTDVFLYDEEPSQEFLDKLEDHYKKEMDIKENYVEFMYERIVMKPIIEDIKHYG